MKSEYQQKLHVDEEIYTKSRIIPTALCTPVKSLGR
jgi:hypothetical protein